ncbi:MAG TPA: hypothetical protein VGR37_07575 [Longimicrobiaceae bacterium]|nr:hypothetical protein [Longimicrobiaceae bacterium]
MQRPAAEQILVYRGRDVEVTLRSGERVLLRGPEVEGDSVFGGWSSGASGDRRAAVALAEIEQVRAVSPPRARREMVRQAETASLMVLVVPLAILSWLIFGRVIW